MWKNHNYLYISHIIISFFLYSFVKSRVLEIISFILRKDKKNNIVVFKKFIEGYIVVDLHLISNEIKKKGKKIPF